MHSVGLCGYKQPSPERADHPWGDASRHSRSALFCKIHYCLMWGDGKCACLAMPCISWGRPPALTCALHKAWVLERRHVGPGIPQAPNLLAGIPLLGPITLCKAWVCVGPGKGPSVEAQGVGGSLGPVPPCWDLNRLFPFMETYPWRSKGGFP